MKSHDFHAIIQVFLPIAICAILPKHVRIAITRLCSFFNTICIKGLDPHKLDSLQDDITVTLCQFEMYLPPSFFNIMVHLVVHLVQEIKYCGSVFFRWSYSFERQIGGLRKKVKNLARPEGSIIQAMVTEEIGEFCSEFIAELGSIRLPQSRHEGRLVSKGIVGFKIT